MEVMALLALSDLKGLASVEEKLVFYRKNEVIFGDKIAVLKRDVSFKDSDISWLKSELEKVKLEKESYHLKIENFKNASKSIDQLLGKGLGYSAVPPPHPLIYNRPNKLDMSYSGIDEFKESEFKGYGPENSKQESNVVCDKKSDNSKENSNESLVEEQVSQDKSSFVESSLNVDKEIVFPVNKKVEFTKPKNHEKQVKKSIRSGPNLLNTARQSHFNAIRTNQVNAVKASACWVWRPIKPNSASITLKRYEYIDGNPETELEDSVRLNSPEDKKVTRARKTRNYQEESFTYKEEMTLMALSDSVVKTCSKTYLKNHETLKKQYDDLRTEFNKSQSNLANYKRGLASVEEQLVFYKKNEVMLYDQIVVLKRDASFNESEINALKIQIERLKKEKDH
ncbi:hypothetical protein Tco_0665119 [Tanacetum coccineum]